MISWFGRVDHFFLFGIRASLDLEDTTLQFSPYLTVLSIPSSLVLWFLLTPKMRSRPQGSFLPLCILLWGYKSVSCWRSKLRSPAKVPFLNAGGIHICSSSMLSQMCKWQLILSDAQTTKPWSYPGFLFSPCLLLAGCDQNRFRL